MKLTKYLVVVALIAFMGMFLVSCESDDAPLEVEPEPMEIDLQTVMSVATAADANPEIVRMIPGTNDKAVFVASATNQLFPITYTDIGFTIDTPLSLAPGSATAEMTSIDVSPVIGGTNYVAVCVAEADCSKGWMLRRFRYWCYCRNSHRYRLQPRWLRFYKGRGLPDRRL